MILVSYLFVATVALAMNVFVLTTGRTGSTGFAMACRHISNFSAGHESRARSIGASRLDYPDNHVEVDNRLVWFLGGLDRAFPGARYVHLTRDSEEVARSYNRRWHQYQTIVRAWKDGVLMGGRGRPLPICRDYVANTNENIALFVRDRPSITVELERIDSHFPAFWQWIGAEGDLAAAMSEWPKRHNSSAEKRLA